MTAYDRLRAEALEALTGHLSAKGVPEADGAEITDALGHASLPGFLGLLANSKGATGPLGQDVLHEAAARIAQTPSVKQANVEADDVERLLTAVFVHGASPDALLADRAVRDVVMRAAVEQLAKQTGAPMTPAQVSEAVALLTTGEFFGDAASALGAVAFAVRGLPLALVTDVTRFPHRVIVLGGAVARDLVGTPFIPLRVLQDITEDGKLDHPPGVLTQTMACLLRFASVKSTAHMLSELIRPDNRSVRLALVVYARANGIPLEDADLDVLRDHVLNTDRPDLGPVLVAAVDRYLAHSGQDQLLAVLRQVSAAGR